MAVTIATPSLNILPLFPSDPAGLYLIPLTSLEVSVINLLFAGYSARDAALNRHIRLYRVRDIVRCVCRKLGVPGRQTLLTYWECELFQEGMIALKMVPYPRR